MTAQNVILEAEEAGKQLVEDWFVAYNNNDGPAHRALLRYPLVSFGGAREGRDNLAVAIRNDGAGWAEDQPGQGLLYRDQQWDHSVILSQRPLQVAADKTHVLTNFTRNLADGTAYGVGLSRLTIGTRDTDGWWIRVLSSCGLRDPERPEEETDGPVTTAAREVIKGIIETLNARDTDRVRALCHYPFVRIPGPVFEFVEVPEEHDLLSEECTRLEVTRLEIHPPQAGDKVVVELEARRFGPDGTELEAEGVVCLITRHSERWGLQLCSTRSALPGLP